ncbi:MAG TPA: serine/threonine-protein kinase [Ktedonobacteraceae bacterium]
MPELAGVMVGNYFLLERLSNEGMVETYLARPTNQGGYDVYLRLFRPRFPDTQAFRDHFPVEVRKVWRCQHPHIQALTEFGAGDDMLYTATRADDTLTLEQVLEKQGSRRLPVALVAKLITQLCEALQYAHEHEIVHGNLQPSSILIDSAGCVRLTDFGLRRAYQEGDPTVAQVEEGNAAYVAPEQVVGMLCPASDTYALGVLLYRLFSGRLPYDAESAGEIAMLHAHEPIPSLNALRSDLPASVDLVMRMALEKGPEARFPTPHAFAAALIQALAKDSPPTIAVPPVRRIAVNPRRTSLTWSRALSLLALMLIMVGLSSTLYLFSFSQLPFSDLPALPFRASGGTGSFSILFPRLRPDDKPTPGSPGEAAANSPTPGQRHHATPTPGEQDSPTPVASSTPGIQQSPIIVSASPTAGVPPITLSCVPGSLKIDGSFYLAPLLQRIGIDYQTFCPGFNLILAAQGCRVGLTALENGQIDLAASDLSVQTTQKLTDYPVAALLSAVVVSPDVQLSGLSSQQLQAIYQGQVTNWSQVGGPDEAISVLLHPSSDPLNAIFQTFVLHGTSMHVRGSRLNKKLTPEQVAQKVARTPGAITYVPLDVTGTVNVHILALDRVPPTLQNVLQGTYAFWSVEHLYTSANVTAQVQAYIQFFQATPESNRLAQVGALPLNSLPPPVLAAHMPGPIMII